MKNHKNSNPSQSIYAEQHRGDGETTTDWENYADISNYHKVHISDKHDQSNKNKIGGPNDNRPSKGKEKAVAEGAVPFGRTMNIAGCWFPYFGDNEVTPMENKWSQTQAASRPSSGLHASLREDVPRRFSPSSSGRKETLQELLQCVLCWDVFIEATTVGCGHTFCRSCLHDWKRKRKWCPICQKLIKVTIRSINLDKIVQHLLPSLPIQSQERVRAAQTIQIQNLQNRISKAESLAQSSLGRLRLWFGFGYNSKKLTRTGSALLKLGIVTKGIFDCVKETILKLYQCLKGNEEYHRMENISFLVLSPTGILFTGTLIGCFLTGTSEVWSYLFHLVDSQVDHWNLKRWYAPKGCSKENCAYNRHF